QSTVYSMTLKDGEGGNPRPKEPVAGAERQLKRTGKPYQQPAFRFEHVFETMALACGKISPTQSHCRFNRKSS
ncbi:MAG: hypothetical protein WA800_08220, partial [Terriglobales bacterium]